MPTPEACPGKSGGSGPTQRRARRSVTSGLLVCIAWNGSGGMYAKNPRRGFFSELPDGHTTGTCPRPSPTHYPGHTDPLILGTLVHSHISTSERTIRRISLREIPRKVSGWVPSDVVLGWSGAVMQLCGRVPRLATILHPLYQTFLLRCYTTTFSTAVRARSRPVFARADTRRGSRASLRNLYSTNEPLFESRAIPFK